MKPTGPGRAPSVGREAGGPSFIGLSWPEPRWRRPSFTGYAVSEVKPLAPDTAMTLRETANPEVAGG